MIKAGKYDQKVSFVSFGNQPDGFGGTIVTEATVLTTFAWVKQVNGGDNLEQAQLTLPKTYKVGIQIRSGFEPNTSMMVKYRGNDYKITAIEQMEERNAKEWILTVIGITPQHGVQINVGDNTLDSTLDFPM